MNKLSQMLRILTQMLNIQLIKHTGTLLKLRKAELKLKLPKMDMACGKLIS